MTHQKQKITCGKCKSVFDLADWKIFKEQLMLCVHTYIIMYKSSWLGILMSNVKSCASVWWISKKEEQQEGDEKLFLIK